VEVGQATLEAAFRRDREGLEAEAIPLYERAIEEGLTDDELASALLGLGSSLRNVGRHDDAVAILEDGCARFPDHAALRTFLALARWSRGEHAGSVRELVEALVRADAPGMRRYERAIRGYAAEL
jgi:tetratricopeptide (TPR) repeat protein